MRTTRSIRVQDQERIRVHVLPVLIAMAVQLASLCIALQLFLGVYEVTSLAANDCTTSRCKFSTPVLRLGRPSCKCDNECALYDDCCSDFTPSADARSGESPLHKVLECSKVDFTGGSSEPEFNGWPMVSACLQQTDHVQDQCTNASLFLPVTDPRTNFTFRNVYCAQCNNITQGQVVPWKPEFNCPLTTAQSLQVNSQTNIMFEAVKEICFLIRVAPRIKSPVGRSCIPHVSTCPNTNSSHDLVHNCTRGPYDLVTTPDKGRVFRNQYCAQCNEVNNTQCLMLPFFTIKIKLPTSE